MTQKLSTYNENTQISEDQKKTVELVLSAIPEGMNEQHASVLWEMCFHKASTVATNHGMKVDTVRSIKRREKDTFDVLYYKRMQILERMSEGALFDILQLVSGGLALIDVGDMTSPQKLASIASVGTQINNIRKDLNTGGDGTEGTDVLAAAKAISSIKTLIKGVDGG